MQADSSAFAARTDLRILTVVVDLDIGGTQRVAQNVSMELKRRGLAVAVLAHSGGGPRSDILNAAGVPVFVRDIEAALSWRPDVVHIHRSGYKNTFETRLLRRFRATGARIVETNIFARFDHSPGGRLIDAHCLLTEWCLFKWSAWGGSAAARRRFYVIPNAVDTDAFFPLSQEDRETVRAQLGVPRGRFLLGRVGQPSPAKWSVAAILGFQEALSTGLDLGLLLVGAPDDVIRAVESQPREIRERIVLREKTSSDVQLASYYGAMDAMLHAAQIGETFGMVICEAMLMGKPVITLSTPFKDNGQLEVVGHLKGGLVALQTSQLAKAIEMLVRDQSLYDDLSSGAREWVLDRFNAAAVVDKFCEVYTAVVSEPKGRPTAAPPGFGWAEEMAARGIGRPLSRLERFSLRLLHVPMIYWSYALLRQALRGA
jgi:glycosyltransferase involved in cell wall biosynthesis